MMSYIMSIFIYYRGAIRYKAFRNSDSEWLNEPLLVNLTAPTLSPNSGDNNRNTQYRVGGEFMTTGSSTRFIEWEVPWYNNYPFLPWTPVYNAQSPDYELQPDDADKWAAGYRAFGDDFSLGYLASPPFLSETAGVGPIVRTNTQKFLVAIADPGP